jgi:hypothetical protein
MKSIRSLFGIGIVLLMITPVLRADASAYAAIVKERDTVLSKIVAIVESQNSFGTADDEAVWSAKFSLLSFRRDTALTVGEKLKQQELIVALQEKRLNSFQERSKTGMRSPLDVLRATDALLAAKQLQAELQLNEKKG